MTGKRKRLSLRLTFLAVVLITINALAACVPPDDALPPLYVTALSPEESGWLEIHFTNPTSLTAYEYQGGPDDELASAIEDANLSVDVAVYSFNLWSIRDALINAHKRGVVVRMVMESDNMDSREAQELLDAGISILGDQHEGLMHDKFVIIDRAEVWTGSMNFTVSGAYQDNNNLIRIRSAAIAENYLVEFNEMFVDNRFGNDSRAGSPFPQFKIAESTVEVLFAPEDDAAARIISLIRGAQVSIRFLASSFTSDDIGSAIIDRAQEGLLVSGVMDADQAVSNEGSEYELFTANMLDVRLDALDGLMHHKVIIIDDRIVITGSYNFSNNAETRNDENVIILHDKQAAEEFLKEFRRIYGMAIQ